MLQKIKDFGELVVFKHTIFSSTFLLVAVAVAFHRIESINATLWIRSIALK